MTIDELVNELENFKNKMEDHAEFICFLKPNDKKEEVVMINGHGGNLAALITIARMKNKNVQQILKVSNVAFEKFKDKVQP